MLAWDYYGFFPYFTISFFLDFLRRGVYYGVWQSCCENGSFSYNMLGFLGSQGPYIRDHLVKMSLYLSRNMVLAPLSRIPDCLIRRPMSWSRRGARPVGLFMGHYNPPWGAYGLSTVQIFLLFIMLSLSL